MALVQIVAWHRAGDKPLSKMIMAWVLCQLMISNTFKLLRLNRTKWPKKSSKILQYFKVFFISSIEFFLALFTPLSSKVYHRRFLFICWLRSIVYWMSSVSQISFNPWATRMFDEQIWWFILLWCCVWFWYWWVNAKEILHHVFFAQTICIIYDRNWLMWHEIYPIKYTHFAVCCYCLILAIFTHILQGYFTGTGAIIWLPQCLWCNLEGYG